MSLSGSGDQSIKEGLILVVVAHFFAASESAPVHGVVGFRLKLDQCQNDALRSERPFRVCDSPGQHWFRLSRVTANSYELHDFESDCHFAVGCEQLSEGPFYQFHQRFIRARKHCRFETTAGKDCSLGSNLSLSGSAGGLLTAAGGQMANGQCCSLVFLNGTYVVNGGIYGTGYVSNAGSVTISNIYIIVTVQSGARIGSRCGDSGVCECRQCDDRQYQYNGGV
jgi:hypothetical protein